MLQSLRLIILTLSIPLTLLHEGVHFPKDSLPEDIAYRATAIALSDLAAMGAYPKFFSIGLMMKSRFLGMNSLLMPQKDYKGI